MAMKICFVTQSPLPWGGNAARELEYCVGLVRSGHEVHVMAPHVSEKAKNMDKLEGIIFHGERTRYFYKTKSNLSVLTNLSNLWYYFKKIDELKDEVDVFVFENPTRSLLGAIYKNILRVPTVASLPNSATSDLFERGYPSKRDLRYFKFRLSKEIKERFLTPHHDVILFPTEKGKKYFLDKYSTKFNGKCFTIPNPIDPKDVEKFKKNSSVITERKPIIGRFTNPRGGGERNEDLKETIIPRVVSKFQDAKFLLIGKKPPVENRIDSEHVEYTGYVDDLDDVFQKLQVGIVTGHVNKGGGFRSRGTEFIKRGIPLIGYPPEAIRPSWGFAEKKGGVELKNSSEKVAEAIIQILGTEEKLRKMNRASFDSAEELYYDKVIPRLEESFEVAIKEFEY